MRKILSLLLVLALLLSSVPAYAGAEDVSENETVVQEPVSAETETVSEPDTPVDEPKEEPAPAKPAEEPKQEPKEEPTEPAPAKPAEEPKEEPTEPAPTEPEEEPKEEPTEPAPTEPEEEPKEEPSEPAPTEPEEEPKEEPTEPVPTEPEEEPKEEPTEPAPTEPEEEPKEEPSEPAPTDPAEEIPSDTADSMMETVNELMLTEENLLMPASITIIPERPRSFMASPDTEKSIYLQWRAASIGDGYEVQRSLTSDFATAWTKAVNDINQNNYTYSGLTCGQLSYFRVRTFADAEGERAYSDWSDVVSIYPSPNAPDSLTGEAASAVSVKLTWSTVSLATGYYIYRDNALLTTITNKATNSFTDSGLVIGQEYNYKIYTYYRYNGNNVRSVDYAELDYKAAPPTPSGLTAKSSGVNVIQLNWKEVSGVDGYRIYRSTDNGANFLLLATVSGDSTLTYRDTTVTTGEEYRYQIRSFVISGDESAPSAVVIGKAVPETPGNVSAKYVSATSIKISWSAVAGVKGYVVYGSNDLNGEYEEIYRGANTSYTEEGLAVGQGRFYKVSSYMNVAESEPCNVVYDMTRPAAPRNLTLTNVPGQFNQIEVSWDEAADADGYELYRSTTSNSSGFSRILSTADTQYIHKSLACGTTYYYKVRAYVVGGLDSNTRYYGAFSEVKSLKAQTAAPDAVSAHAASSNSITVNWTSTYGANGYYVYYQMNGGSSVYVTKLTGKNTVTYTVKNLKPGNTYVMLVRAYRDVNGKAVIGKEGKSGEVTLELTAPVNLRRSPSNLTSVKLLWNEVAGATGYEVNVVCEEDAAYELTQKVTATSLQLTNLECGYHYVCKVRAYTTTNGITNEGPYSEPYTVTTMPATPTNFAGRALQANYGAYLTWTAAKEGTGYRIQRAESQNGPWEIIKELDGLDHTTYTDNLGPSDIGKTYYYRICSYVMALGNKNLSYYSPVVSLTVTPPRPKVTASPLDARTIQLDWTEIEGVTGYYIYRSTSSSGTYTQIKSASGNSTKNGNLKTGTRYYYKVRAYAVDDSGKTVLGTLSAPVSVVPGLTAPENVNATPYGKRIKITWSKVTGADGYYIYRMNSNGTYVQVGSAAKTATSYTNTGLACGTTYRYKVAAYLNNGGSHLAGKQSEAVSATTALTAPTKLTSTVMSTSSIRLTWNTALDAEGYTLYACDTPDGKFTKLADISGGSTKTYTVTGLPFCKTRYYYLKAYANVNGKRLYSEDTSNTLAAYTVPMAATELKCTAKTATSITINWKAGEKATGYRVYYRDTSTTEYTLADTIYGADVTSYQITGLEAGTHYYIKLRSLYSDEEHPEALGKYSTWISVATR